MAVSTRKTAAPRRKAAPSGSEALSACIAKTASENEPAAEHPDATDLSEANRQSLQAFVEANEAIMNGMSALSAEMAAFGGKRLSANLERSQSLAGCDDAEKAFRIQSEFFESAMRQYLEQAGNVMEIMASISTGFWSAFGQGAAEVLQDQGRETGAGETS